VGGSFATYDELKHGLGSLLWETAHQQRQREGVDPVIAKGSAFISPFAYEPVLSRIEAESDEPAAPGIVKRLEALRRDPWLRPTYRTALPEVPLLVPMFIAGDEQSYENLQNAYRGAEKPLLGAVEAGLRGEERALVDLLFLEVSSSQLSALSNVEGARARALMSPSRNVVPSANGTLRTLRPPYASCWSRKVTGVHLNVQ
jgi:hypothetical protein